MAIVILYGWAGHCLSAADPQEPTSVLNYTSESLPLPPSTPVCDFSLVNDSTQEHAPTQDSTPEPTPGHESASQPSPGPDSSPEPPELQSVQDYSPEPAPAL